MALSVNAFNAQIDSLINGIPEVMLRINTEVSLDSIPKITSRLTDRGLTAEGKSLGKYSDRPMNPLFFLGKGLKGADVKVNRLIKAQRKAGEKPGVSYEQWREFNNLPTEHVTLSFTTETLGDIGIVGGVIENGKAITTIGSKNTKKKDVFDKRGKKIGEKTTGDVLDELNEKYGFALDTDLLDLTEQEEEELSQRVDQKLQNYIDSVLR